MSGIPDATPVADGFPLFPLRIGEGMAGSRSLAVCRVRLPDFGDRRNDLPGHTDSVTRVVSRHVLGDDPEERRQRVGAATSAGAEEL